MAQLRAESSEQRSWQQKGHGKYDEITEEDFLKTVTKSTYAVVHFYHREFPRSKIVDHHLEILAKKYLATKFCKLQVMVMPCVCMFQDGVMCGRLDGFDPLGGVDEFPTEVMECVIGASGAISFKPDCEQEAQCGA